LASLFGFKTRSPERDRDTDRERLARLSAFLGEMADQIAAERTGLERRYREASTNAGFLADAMENEEVSAGSSHRLDAMTDDMLNYERRLAALSRQIGVVEDLRARAQALLD